MKVESRKKVWVVLTLDKTSGRETLSGILEFLSDKHDWDMELDLHPDRITPKRVKDLVKDGVNGVILSMPCPPRAQAALAATALPIVCVNVQDDALAARAAPTRFVWTDNAAIGNAAAAHLLACGGFASYAFLGQNGQSWSDARGRGFSAVLSRAGHRAIRFGVDDHQPTPRESAGLREFLAALPKPAAVFAAYDELAFHCIVKVARKLKIRIPEQLAVVGADNTENIVEPTSLSSVRLAHAERGHRAAAALHRMLQGRSASPEPINIAPLDVDVVQRRSTRVNPDAHTLAREIRQFIDRHALTDDCSAEAIAAHFGVSRSTVEHRFRAAEGVSLHRAVLDVRLDAAAEKIAKSPRTPLSKIAAACGFSSADHLSRLFKAHRGATPRKNRTHK